MESIRKILAKTERGETTVRDRQQIISWIVLSFIGGLTLAGAIFTFAMLIK